MSVVEDLMATAEADVDLLRSLDAKGDNFAVQRDVDFSFHAPTAEKAELIRDFINEYQYGVASVHEDDGVHRIQVVVNMPIQQHIIGAVSGFMVCVAHLYELEYLGWGCVVQKHT